MNFSYYIRFLEKRVYSKKYIYFFPDRTPVRPEDCRGAEKVSESSKIAPTEAPKEAPKDAPKEAPKDAPKDAPTEYPQGAYPQGAYPPCPP